MTLYEANFIKLNRLVGSLASTADSSISYSEHDCNLHLSIEQRSRYTCELRLTYLFTDISGVLADPDLLAKVYFDARMAEVRSWVDDHQHFLLKSLDQQYKREVDRCWVRNIMFSKWLDYLLDKGHRFSSRVSEAPANRRSVDSVKA